MPKRRPTRRDLLVVIARLQGYVGSAKAYHGNDRNPDGFELGQNELDKAFDLCVEVAAYDRPVSRTSGPWGEKEG